MAIINDPNVAAQIAALAQGGTIDSNAIVSLLNSALPAGQQLQSGTGVTTRVYKRFGEFDKVNHSNIFPLEEESKYNIIITKNAYPL